MTANIIRWNIDKDHNPIIICLQETNFNIKSNHLLHHFNILKRIRNSTIKSSGLISILVNHNYLSKEITHSDLEVIALSIILPPCKFNHK